MILSLTSEEGVEEMKSHPVMLVCDFIIAYGSLGGTSARSVRSVLGLMRIGAMNLAAVDRL